MYNNLKQLLGKTKNLREVLFYNADLMLADPQVGIHLLLLCLRSAQEVHTDSILIQNLMYNIRTNKTVFVQSEFFNEGL